MAGQHDRLPEAPAAAAELVAARLPAPSSPGVTRRAALMRQLATPRAGVPNRVLARDLDQTAFLPGPGAPSQVPQGPQRGVNPADGIAAITRRFLRPAPTGQAALRTAALAWADAVVALIAAAAGASGASHAQLISANEADEIPRAVRQLLDDYFGPSAARGSGRLRDAHESLLALAARKEAEVRVQFHHNVIVETDERGWFGYSGSGDLTRLDATLTGMPQQHVWGAAARPLRFRRQMSAPGAPGTGGETEPLTSTITLYSSGMGPAPYRRSAALGLPGFEQTIRHEIGHTVEHGLSAAARTELFTGIMDWHRFPWAWVSVPDPPYPTWRAERDALARETGLEGAALDEWLAGFAMRTGQNDLARSDTRVRGSRSYVRSQTQGDLLHSIKAAEVPDGPEFDYALTAENDYLAELYTFAVSRPFWLAGKISREQKSWWRRQVFGTPGSDSEILRVEGMDPEVQMRFARLVPGLFTWEQIREALAAARAPENVG